MPDLQYPLVDHVTESIQFREKSWLQELELHTGIFAAEISALKIRDAEVIKSRIELESLQALLTNSFAEHFRLSRQLDILESYQREIEEVLSSLSVDLNRLETLTLSSNNDRELIFTFGEEVSSKLKTVSKLFPGSDLMENSELLQETEDHHASLLFNLLKVHLRELQRLEQKLHTLVSKESTLRVTNQVESEM